MDKEVRRTLKRQWNGIAKLPRLVTTMLRITWACATSKEKGSRSTPQRRANGLEKVLLKIICMDNLGKMMVKGEGGLSKVGQGYVLLEKAAEAGSDEAKRLITAGVVALV